MSTCQGDLTNCHNDLSENGKTVEGLNSVIVTLKGEIKQLTDSNAQCNGDYSGLRCSVNKFLSIIENNEVEAVKALINIQGLFDQSKAVLGQFLNNNNIACDTCGVDGPCVTGGNALL